MTLKEEMEAALAAKKTAIAKLEAEIATIEETIKTHGQALEVEAESFLAKIEAEARAGLDKFRELVASVRAHL
jgi:hypothetical protein